MSKNTDDINLPLETILDTLPITGTWTLQKCEDADPAKRYIMSWRESIKGRTHGVTKYAGTAKKAAALVLIEIKGLLTDREAYEPD